MKIAQKNILFYLPSFQAGGAERQALNLAQEFKSNYDAKVTLAAQYGGGPIEKECNKLGIEHIVLPFNFYYFKYQKLRSLSYSNWKAHLIYVRQKRNFIKVIKKANPDFILSYCYEPNVIACYFSNYYKNVKIIWNQRDVGTPPLNKDNIEKKAIDSAFKIVGNSKAAENYIKNMYEVSSKVSNIPNGIHFKELGTVKLRSDFGFLPTDKVISMIANYASTKNHRILIEAYSKIQNPTFKLLLIGRFTKEEKDRLQELTEKKIVFHYEEDSITSLIRMCDSIVHASFSEGMPNAVLESMFCERLIIASNIEPHKEVLGEDYPLLFDPTNSEQLTKLLLESNSKSYEALIRANRTKVMENYSVSKLAKNYLEIFNG